MKFTAAWDKLRAPRFTTIRSFRPQKMEFYDSRVGDVFTILLVRNEWSNRGRRIGEATLLSVAKVHPQELPVALVEADLRIGGEVDAAWLTKILAMDYALLLTFENHTGLLGGR